MKQLKKKLEKITLSYIELFPDEYATVVMQLSAERERNKDKFASVSPNGVIQRKIFEIPETLFKMYQKELSVEELVQFKDGDGAKEIQYWLVKRFPEFAGGNTL